MNNKYYKSPNSSWLKRLFWRAAGADRYLLERSTYSDQIKYFCLGGIVVATGAMAALAGGYAFYTIFEPRGDALDKLNTINDPNAVDPSTVFLAVIFGVIWGLIIFNIDRFIVTSTGKGDGTEAITKQEIKSSIPRILMGMIIALTISKPVEIRMFKSELDVRIGNLQDEERDALQKETDLVMQDLYYNEIDSLILSYESKIEAEDSRLSEQKSKVQDLQQQYIDETTRPGRRGIGDIANGILEQKNLENQRLTELILETNSKKDQYNSSIAELKEERKNIDLEKEEKYAKIEKRVAGKDGLLLRLRLAHEEAGWVISLFITLLFMVIELTPIFFKMMLIKGPYDYMSDNVKELARADLGIEIEYDFYTDKEGVDKHKVTNYAAEVKRKEKVMMLKAQDELNEKIIQKWKESESKKIDENPDEYISNE